MLVELVEEGLVVVCFVSLLVGLFWFGELFGALFVCWLVCLFGSFVWEGLLVCWLGREGKVWLGREGWFCLFWFVREGLLVCFCLYWLALVGLFWEGGLFVCLACLFGKVCLFDGWEGQRLLVLVWTGRFVGLLVCWFVGLFGFCFVFVCLLLLFWVGWLVCFLAGLFV